MERPELSSNLPVDDFKNFYWLKEELVKFCKEKGINTRGSKIQISERIVRYLDAGETGTVQDLKLNNPQSRFDWSKEVLSYETVITDNYKNTENVRNFFRERIGSHFHFYTDFMKWMKSNPGKTFKDAEDEWKRLYHIKKDKNIQSEIAPQFEYNRYIRAFLKDNPDMKLKDAIKYWKIKKSLPGNNEYSENDLEIE